MSNPELLKPMWENECPICIFLGGYIDEDKRMDFWLHGGSTKAPGPHTVLFIRQGPAGDKEVCCKVAAANDGLFEIARRRAQELGLLNEESQHG